MLKKILLATAVTTSLLGSAVVAAADKPILNASYDVARELFAEILSLIHI